MEKTTPEAPFGPESTMHEIMNTMPGARRALFQKYHIGGCSSCGFHPSETLGTVLERHGVDDIDGVIAHLQEAEALDRKMQVEPETIAAELGNGQADKLRLIDVRTPEEWDVARIEGAKLLDGAVLQEIKALPKDTPLVFYCHTGLRSLDVGAYFVGHGFTNVRSMRGGIDAWSTDVDPEVPRYRFQGMH